MNWYGHSNRYFSSLKLRVTSGSSCRGRGSSRATVRTGGAAVSTFGLRVARSKNTDRLAYMDDPPGEKDSARYFCARVTAT